MSERFMLIGKTKNMFIIAKKDIDRINCFSYKHCFFIAISLYIYALHYYYIHVLEQCILHNL